MFHVKHFVARRAVISPAPRVVYGKEDARASRDAFVIGAGLLTDKKKAAGAAF
jgi:hypothetical protein